MMKALYSSSGAISITDCFELRKVHHTICRRCSPISLRVLISNPKRHISSKVTSVSFYRIYLACMCKRYVHNYDTIIHHNQLYTDKLCCVINLNSEVLWPGLQLAIFFCLHNICSQVLNLGIVRA